MNFVLVMIFFAIHAAPEINEPTKTPIITAPKLFFTTMAVAVLASPANAPKKSVSEKYISKGNDMVYIIYKKIIFSIRFIGKLHTNEYHESSDTHHHHHKVLGNFHTRLL